MGKDPLATLVNTTDASWIVTNFEFHWKISPGLAEDPRVTWPDRTEVGWLQRLAGLSCSCDLTRTTTAHAQPEAAHAWSDERENHAGTAGKVAASIDCPELSEEIGCAATWDERETTESGATRWKRCRSYFSKGNSTVDRSSFDFRKKYFQYEIDNVQCLSRCFYP